MDPKNTDQQSQPEIPSEHYAGIFDEPPAPAISSAPQDASQATPQGTVTLSSPTINSVESVIPAALGAGAGEMLLKKGPKPDYMTPAFQEATTAASDAGITKDVLQNSLNNINNLHLNSINQLENVHADHLETLKQLRAKLDEAHHRATMLDALDFGERKVAGAPMSYNYGAVIPGEKIPHKLLTQVEDMSKANEQGTSAWQIAEKNRIAAAKQKALGYGDYRLSGELEGELYKPPVQGVTPGEQRLARKAYELAKAEHDSHAEITSKIGKQLEELKSISPKGKEDLTKKLTHAEIERQKALEKLSQLSDQPSFIGRSVAKLPYGQETLNMLEKANRAMNANPVLRHVLPTVGGGLGTIQGLQGIEDWQKGQKLKGALEAISGAGGVLSAVPHPLARGVGLGMQLPYLGYEGYEYLSDKLKR
jgi:flagellar biosynthesis chaperone FliJ